MNMNQMPTSLQQQLQAAQRRLWAVETTVAVVGGLCGLLISYLLLFLSDRLWDTPAWLRFACTATGVVGAALGAWWWASHLNQRRDPRALARLVQKRYPRLGDRLLSIVELSHAETLPANISQTLVNAAMRQVASESSALSFESAVPTHWLRRWMPASIVALGLTVTALLMMPSAGLNAWKRWFNPTTAEERFTFTQLKPLGNQRIVAYGEPFTVQAQLSADSKWRPADGRARVERQVPVGTKLRGDEYSFEIPGQTKAGQLAIAVGDARESTSIEPMFRPDLVALQAEIELPDYLQYPPQKVDARKGSLELLEGSRVSFAGKVGRVLQEAVISGVTTNGHDSETLAVRGGEFVSGKLALAESNLLKFNWRDEVGLSGRTPFELKVVRRADEPPIVACRGLQRATAILEDETLDFQVEAEDDFGVKQVGTKWQVVDSATGGNAAGLLPSGVSQVVTGGPQDRVLGGETRFSPKVLGIGPGRVLLRATARDYRPDRPEIESAVHTILILDRSEHAKLVQQMMDKIAQQLEEIANTEQQNMEMTQRLREELAKLLDQAPNAKEREKLEKQIKELSDKLAAEKNKAKPDDGKLAEMEKELKKAQEDLAKLEQDDVQKQLDKLTEQLNEAKEQEQANREAAKEAAEDLKKLGKEALRNEQIPSQSMKEMAELMEMLQKLSQGEMQQAQQNLQNAQNANQQSQQQQRDQQMAEAQKNQEEAYKKLRELAKQMQQAGENLLAETFINRLKASAKNQKEIGGELSAVAPRTVGATLAQLPPELRQRLELQESNQKQTQKKVKDIRDDMGFLLRRQTNEALNDVQQEMEKVAVVDELGKVAGLINRNLTAQAIEQTGRWEKQLQAWADKLRKAQKEGGGGGGGGGGGQQEIPPWVIELVLRLARIRQQEEDLREQTRAVEERREVDKKYVERAKELADRQDKLLTDFDNIPEQAQVPAAAQMQLAQLWEAVDLAMADAIVTMRKPDTGGDAIAAQTEVIELLGKVLDQAGQSGGGGGGGGAGQMASLQQMMQMLGRGMGMGAGGAGSGGNPMGGGTSEASGRGTGRGDGNMAGERRVDQAGGRDMASVPVEFREALEGYYNAVDKKK